jgi:hypothetical protein
VTAFTGGGAAGAFTLAHSSRIEAACAGGAPTIAVAASADAKTHVFVNFSRFINSSRLRPHLLDRRNTGRLL